MKHSVKNTDLKKMSAAQQDEALRGLVRATRGQPNGEMKELDSRIQAFEVTHGLSSDELRRAMAQGLRKETWEICQWLMLLDQRDLLGSRKSRTH